MSNWKRPEFPQKCLKCGNCWPEMSWPFPENLSQAIEENRSVALIGVAGRYEYIQYYVEWNLGRTYKDLVRPRVGYVCRVCGFEWDEIR